MPRVLNFILCFNIWLFNINSMTGNLPKPSAFRTADMAWLICMWSKCNPVVIFVIFIYFFLCYCWNKRNIIKNSSHMAFLLQHLCHVLTILFLYQTMSLMKTALQNFLNFTTTTCIHHLPQVVYINLLKHISNLELSVVIRRLLLKK